MILTENLTRTYDDKLALSEKISLLLQNVAVAERAWTCCGVRGSKPRRRTKSGFWSTGGCSPASPRHNKQTASSINQEMKHASNHLRTCKF
jgi:hypothetical protein